MQQRSVGTERSPLTVGLAGLAGAIAGAVGAGFLAAGAWYLTHPNPEGFEGLAVVVVSMLGGAVGSYPGALAGVWLAVRRSERRRATLAWTALLYPLVAVAPLVDLFGFRGPAGGFGFALAFPLALAGCAAARAIATRHRGDADAGPAR